MSSIDNRIVQMQFQNSEFEKGVNESIKSLDKLKKSLEFKESSKSLDSLRHLGDSFNLTRMAGDIEAISERFSALGVIGRRVLENLTDGIYNATTAFVKDLSFNNINAGFDKYIDKTKSVQAIMNATGMSIEGVDKQLTKLQWFTDETSYNFVDMVSNIGKFTSMGVDLETSVTAMQGIANWAAVSGQDVQEASRAMYNLAQAMGIGAVKMTDWKSITLANMGTKEFKETVIDTAKALGVLNKTTSKTKKGTLVNLQNFESTLSEGWFSSDVLLATLKKYGEYADAVYDVQKAYEEAHGSGITAAQAMEMVSDETMKLGAKAFKAAQEYTNFNDTINAVKDAVSSGWMKTFELIFGNYREGIEVWTALGDTLYEVFASGVQARNKILESWKEIGGRTEFISGLTDSLDGLLTIIDAVKTGFRDVFPQKTAEQVKEITDKIANFGHELSELYHTYEKFTGEYKEEDVFGDNYKSNKAYEELKRGSRGESVKDLQKRLHMLGYGDIVGVADGIFGPKTEAALKKFQEDTGLTIDGIYDDASHKNILGVMFEKGMALDSEKIGRTAIGKKFIPQYETVFSEQAEELRQASKNMFTAIKGAFTSTGKNGEIISKANREAIIKTVTTFTALAVVVMKNSSIWQNLGKIFHGVVSIFSIGLKVFGFFARIIAHVVRLLMPLIETIFYLGGVVGDAIGAFDAWITKSGILDTAFETITTFLEPLRGLFIDVKNAVLDFFGIEPKSMSITEALEQFSNHFKGIISLISKGEKKTSKFQELWTKLKDNFKNSKALEKLKETYADFKEKIDSTIESLKAQWTTVKETLGTKFTDFISGLPDKISNITDTLATLLSDGLTLVGKWVTKVPSIVTKLKSFWDALFGTKTLKGGGKKPGIFVKVKQSFQSLIDYLFGNNKVGEPKKVGMVSRILRVASGDMVGAKEGMSDQEFESFINKINKIKEFFKQFGLAIKFLFSGDVIGASELNTGIFVKISRFRSTVVKIFDAIRLLFTGNVREGTSLSQDSQDKIKKIRDTIKNVFLGFINAIKFIFTGSFTSFEGLSADSVQKLAKFRASFMKFFDAIGLLFTGSVREGTSLSEESQEKIKSFHDAITGVFSTIGTTFLNIWNTISGFFSGKVKFDSIGDLFKDIWSQITGMFKNIGGILSSNFGKAFEGIKNFFMTLWDFVKKYGKWVLIGYGAFKIIQLISNIGGAFKSLGKTIASYKSSSQALSKTVMEFAVAIALVAGSIWLIGQLDKEQLGQGLRTVIGIFAILAILMAIGLLVGKKTKKGTKAFKDIGNALLNVALAIGIIAGVSYLIGHLDENGIKQFYKGLELLAWVAGGLLLFIGAFRLFGGANIKLKGVWELAILIGALAFVGYELGKIRDPDQWLSSILSIGAIVAALAILFGVIGYFNKGGSKNKFKFKGLFSLAILIGVLALIFNKMKDLEWAQIWKGFVGLLAITAPIILIFLAMSKLAKEAKTGEIVVMFLGMLAIIGALAGVAYLLESQKIDPERLKGFAYMLGAALIGFSIAFAVVGNVKSFKDAGSIIGTAATLALAVDAMLLLVVAMNWLLGRIDRGMGGTFKEDVKRGEEIIVSVAETINEFVDKLDASISETWTVIGAITLASVLNRFGLSFITGATGVGASIAILIGIATAVAAALGTLDDWTKGQLLESVESGGDVLAAMGTVIGTFVGNIKVAYDALVAEGHSDSMAKFGEAVSTFADGVSGLSGYDGLDADVEAAIRIAGNLDAFFSGLEAYPMIELNGSVIEGYATAADQLNTDMSGFGTAIDAFRDGVSGCADDEQQIETDRFAAQRIAGALHTFFETIKPYTVYPGAMEGYYTAPAQLFTDMFKFGTSIGIFREAVSGIASGTMIYEETTTAINIAGELKRFFDEVGKDEINIEEFNEYVKKLDEYLGNVEHFANTIDYYKVKISGIATSSIVDDTGIAVGVARSLAGFFNEIATAYFGISAELGMVAQLFAEKSMIRSFIDYIAGFGRAMQEYQSGIEGISDDNSTIVDDTQTAIDIANKLAGFFDSLSVTYTNIQRKAGALKQLVEDETIQDTIIDAIGSLGKALRQTRTTFTYIGTDIDPWTGESPMVAGIQAAIDGLSIVAGFFVTLSNLKNEYGQVAPMFAEDDWLTETYNNLIAGVSAVMQDMGILAEEAKAYDFTQLSFLTASLKNLSDILSGQGDHALTTDNFLGNLDAADVIQKLTEFTVAVSGSVADNTGTLQSSTDMFNSAGTDLAAATLSGMSSADTSGASKLANNMYKSILKYVPKFADAGRNLLKGIAVGINDKNTANGIYNALHTLAGEMIATLEGDLAINSPSKEGARIGRYFDLGLVQGIEDTTSAVTSSSEKVATSMLEAAMGPLAILSSIISEGIDDSPVITPVVDLTNARLAAGSLSTMFGNQSFGISSRYMAGRAITSTSGTPTTQNQNDSNSVIGAINDMNDRIGELGEAISNMQMVVDSGALVGQVANKMDERLGVIAMRKGRMG